MTEKQYIKGMVSIIIPTFNNASYIVECVDSVESQTYKNIEIIIIDDGSTDNTSEVVSDLIEKYGNITYKKIQNSKSPTARNTGFALAKGEYVCAIDADDIWPEYKLEMQISILNINPQSIVLGGTQTFTVNEKGEKEWGEAINFSGPRANQSYIDSVMRVALEQMAMFTTVMASTKIIQEEGLWNPAVVTAHDWENWIRLAKKYKFFHVDRVFQYYRKNDHSTTAKHKKFQALFFQLYVISLHSKDGVWSWYDTLDYRRIRYDSWIKIYLYERNFFAAFKLLFRAIVGSNMAFCIKGWRLILESLATFLRVKFMGKR